MKIGVIGYGYWGPNLVRNFSETSSGTVAAVADLDPRKLAQLNKRYPAVKAVTDFQEVLRDPTIDAVAIATPVRTHFELGMAALKAGKHVWLEKPMTETSLQARKLVDEARRREKVLFVDHTFVYTGAVRKMADIIRSGDLGRVYYYDSVRVNLGLFQRDVSVISDLAVHDFSSSISCSANTRPQCRQAARITSPARPKTWRTSPFSTSRARSRTPTSAGSRPSRSVRS